MVISWVFTQAKYVDNFFPLGFLTAIFFCVQSANTNLFCHNKLTLKRGKQIISRREKIIHPSRLELELKTLCQEYILCLANVYDFHHSDSFFRRFYYDQYHQFWEKPCKPKKLIILWKLAITTNLNIFYVLLKTAFPYQAKTFFWAHFEWPFNDSLNGHSKCAQK